jgi:hypothetical protein
MAQPRAFLCKGVQAMRIGGFPSTTRRLIYVLPIIMGTVEYLLRVGFRQPDKDAFFPISLTVAGIGLFVALTAASSREACQGGMARSIAALSFWMALLGAVCWIYLLMASFSNEVREIMEFSPFLIGSSYYFAGTVATEWMARRL